MAKDDAKRQLSEDASVNVAELFKVLSEPMRLKILYALMNKQEKSVSPLVEETGGLQANVSKHLGILLDAGVVGRRKKGLYACYRIVDFTMNRLEEVLNRVISCSLSAP